MTTVSNASTADAAQGPLYAKVEAAEAFGRRLLVAHGLSEEDAATMAGCLVRADLRGVDTHGLQFLPQYLDRLRRGLVNPKPDLVVERVTPVVGALDGQNGYGFVVSTQALTAEQHAFRDGGLLYAAGAGGRLCIIRLHQCVAGDAAVGRTRGLPRHQPVYRRSAVRKRAAVRSRHVAGGCRARKKKARGAAP